MWEVIDSNDISHVSVVDLGCGVYAEWLNKYNLISGFYE